MKKLILLLLVIISTTTVNVSADDVATASDLFTIIIEPQEVVAKSGDVVTIQVYVEEDVEVASYRWQLSSNGGTSWSNTSVAGYATDTIKINVTDIFVGRSFLYRCVITDVDGNIVTSVASYVIVVNSNDEDITVESSDHVVDALVYQNELLVKIYRLIVFIFIVSILFLIFKSFIYF